MRPLLAFLVGGMLALAISGRAQTSVPESSVTVTCRANGSMTITGTGVMPQHP